MNARFARRVRSMATLASLGLLAASATARAQNVELRELFPERASVTLGPVAAGSEQRVRLYQLPLPLEVLTRAGSQLSDLRLLDNAGQEIPFLVLSRAAPAARQGELTQSVEATVVSVQQQQEPREGAPATRHEVYVLEPPPTAAGDVPEVAGEPWWLVVQTPEQHFVFDLGIRELGGDAERTLLDGVSLFRLEAPGGGQAVRQHVRFLLPPFSGRLEVRLDGDAQRFLEPRFRFERRRALPPPEEDAEQDALTIDLDTRLQQTLYESGGSESIYRVDRPGAFELDALELETTTPAFRRRVEVDDLLPDGQRRLLGSTLVVRAPARNALERLLVPLEPPRGEELEVHVLNAESPPLEGVRLIGHLHRPVLVFAPPTAGELWLYVGGKRTERPRYDLQSLPLQPPAQGDDARLAARLLDSSQLLPATLRDLAPNPAFEASPVLAFAMRPGADLNAAPYAHRRRLSVPDASSGLASVALPAGDLALLRPDLADLRIRDQDGAQWPFLLRREASTDLVALEIDTQSRTEGGAAKTRYSLRSASSPLPADALELEIATEFFDRAYVLEARLEDGPEPVYLPGGRLRRGRFQDGRFTLPLTSLGKRRIEALELTVSDGSERPLELRSARLRVPVAELRVAARPGLYDLLLGYPEGTAPSYDLERIRPVVLALDAAPATVGELEDNPDFSVTSRLGRAASGRLLLISALVVAVLGLAVLTFRLVHQGEVHSSK